MSGTHPRPAPVSARLRRLLKAAALLLFLLGTTGLVYFRSFQLPAPTGPYAVGTSIQYFVDQSRHDPYSPDPAARRSLVVQLWYPAAGQSRQALAPYMRWREAPLDLLFAPLLHTHSRLDAPVALPKMDAGGFPLLLFSHRWNGRRTQNTALAEDLASHGYVVASIDFPHNAARVELPDGSVVHGDEALEGPKGAAATAQEQIDFWNSSLQLWVADQRFVLDSLAGVSADPASLFYRRLDTSRVGAFGHSFGGAAALALCGVDARVQAAINMDGWTFGGLQRRTAAVPILLLYEDATRQRELQLATLPAPGSVDDQMDRADFAATETSLRGFGGYRGFIAGTQHMDFSDEPLLPPLRRPGYTGPAPPRRVDTLLRETVLQFFDQALRGQPAAFLSPGRRGMPELEIETWPAPLRR